MGMARANESGDRPQLRARFSALGSQAALVAWLLADLDPIVSNGRAAVIRKRITALALEAPAILERATS